MRWHQLDIRHRTRRYAGSVGLVAVAMLATCSVTPALPVAAPSSALSSPAVRIELPPVAAPRPRIIARVVGDGAAIADAEVSLGDGTPNAIVVRTDREGRAHFDEIGSGPYELWATHEGRASSITRVDDVTAETSVTLELAPAATLLGRVIVAGALPPRAAVRLLPIDVDQPTRLATLDDQGRFSIEGLPFGHWRIACDVPGYVQAEQHVLELASAEHHVDVPLERAGTVTGTLVDASGAPVANAIIALRDQSGAVRAGSFELAADSTHWIHPLASARALPANDSTHFGASRPGLRPPECGLGHCGLDLGNQRGAVVHAVASGRIVSLFPDATTEAGRVVVIEHSGGLKSFYMHLDELRPGLEIGQAIRAGDPVGLLGSTGFTRAVPHLHFALTYERFGRTWYLDPEPVIRQAVVLAAPRAYEPVTTPPAKAGDEAIAVHAVTTDAHGAFRVDDVAAGSYVAIAYAPDLPPGRSAPFVVKTGEEASGVTVQLDIGSRVDGRVLGRDGALAGATVIASAGFGESMNTLALTTTDRNGEFTLHSLGGKIALTVLAAGYGDAERTLVLDERDHTSHREDFKLTIEDSQLRGQILAPDGGTPGPVAIRIVDGPTRRTTSTDAQGRFAMAVASGHYVVELSSSEYPAKRVAADSGRWVETRLDPGGGVRCIVRDASGIPVTGARVEAAGPTEQIVSRFTDGHGFVELRGLVAGEWKLSARAIGYIGAAKTVTVRVGRVAQDLALDLTRGATLAGVVRDSRGHRVAGARVWLGTAATQSDADGNFKLLDAPTGDGMLEAEHDGHRGALPLQLGPADERLTLTIELRADP